MRIIKFFTVFTLFFIIELILLTIVQHPSVPFVQLTALSALVVGVLPWYAKVYLLMGVLLSAFVQGFCMATNLVIFGCLMVAHLFFADMIINVLFVQSVVVIATAACIAGFNCPACFTILNSCIAVLFVPCMITFLREA